MARGPGRGGQGVGSVQGWFSYCIVPAASLTRAADLSCIVLFGACIEGVILRDKYVLFMASGNSWGQGWFSRR